MSIDLQEIALRESARVEWKQQGNAPHIVRDIVRTICAFSNDIANVGGGYIVCGAKEGKDAFGFPKVFFSGLSSSQVKEITGKVLQHARDYISPAVSPLVYELPSPDQEDKRVLVFTVIASPEAHTYRDGEKSTYFVRLGTETREARNGILSQLLIKKNKITYFDKRINPQGFVDDIDVILFRDTLQKMGLETTIQSIDNYISDSTQIAEFIPPMFEKSGLNETLKPKNFTILLFGHKRSITRLFPDAHVVVSKYRGLDRSEPTAERFLVQGPLPEQTKKVLDILEQEAVTFFDKSADAPNLVKYPFRAIQEAVVNAIVHRDYELPEPVRITVFSNRIEIYSPGSIHWGIDKNKFMAGQAGPKWRNQSFAYLFNKMQLAQSEGQGIPTIIRLMREAGCPPPVFEHGTEHVTCTLFAHTRYMELFPDRHLSFSK